MTPIVHEFDWPDRVVIGTIGEPGSRTFYLQVRSGARMISIALEKQQSALLGEKIEELLDQLKGHENNRYSVPEATPIELVDNEPLEQPVDEEFRTGTMSLGWDPRNAQVVIEAFPLIDDEDQDDPDFDNSQPTHMLAVRIPVGTAQAFAMRTSEVVGAGRPICALCGTPIDASGHECVLPGDS
jgi:uncharacterized repeat protein (TIGR03847 family)